MFEKIIDNYIKEIRSGKMIGEREMIDLLVQTVAVLANDDDAFRQSKGYVVYSYDRTAAKLAKGSMPEGEEGWISQRLDLAISALMDHLKENKVVSNKTRLLFANRLTAAVHMMTNFAKLPYENKNEILLDELRDSFSIWLKTFAQPEEFRHTYLKAAETEDYQ